jgi:hypothetical protein
MAVFRNLKASASVSTRPRLQRRLPFGAAEGWFPEVCSQARKPAAIMTVRHPTC